VLPAGASDAAAWLVAGGVDGPQAEGAGAAEPHTELAEADLPGAEADVPAVEAGGPGA